jgi:hypothetical protein
MLNPIALDVIIKLLNISIKKIPQCLKTESIVILLGVYNT